MGAILRDSVAVVVVVRMRPRAMPLGMITKRKSTHGFPFLSYMSMGLCLAELLCNKMAAIFSSSLQMGMLKLGLLCASQPQT